LIDPSAQVTEKAMEKEQEPANPPTGHPQSVINPFGCNFIIHHLPTIGSTNDHLKTMIGAPELTCVVADEQTAGRGRHGRAWHSTPGTGLYLSILLCPESSSSKTPLLSLLAGIAVAEVLIQRGVIGVDIKWPNDVLVKDRKICGILVEGASAGSNPHRIILGIGVNLNHRSFPPELSQTATSFEIETGKDVAIDEFRDQLLERIAYWYQLWKGGEERAIIDRWQELSSYAGEKEVVVTVDGERFTGKTAGLSETGSLRVITHDGRLKEILAGEVMKLSRRAGEEERGSG
jgi:BirA family biotin operon repressor/biotin-[acetyl-CoA-carboxylase] ligase